MEKLKENAALSGSRSNGVAPNQEQMNREAADRSSLLQMTAVDKLEETIMDLLREYRMNAFAQQLHEQLMNPAWASQPFLRCLLVCLEAERAVRKERGAEKRFKIAGLPRGAYGLKQFDFAPGRGISRQTLEEIVECRWIAKRVPHQRRDSRRDGQSIAITGATGCGKSFLAMVISSEAIERGFNVRYWSLTELVERLSKAEKKSETLKKINEADLLTIDDFGLGTLTAQEQSLVYEIIKSRADNLSTIIVSQRPCADWYEWLGGKYIADGVADRIINFYYLVELKGESRRSIARKQAKEAAGL